MCTDLFVGMFSVLLGKYPGIKLPCYRLIKNHLRFFQGAVPLDSPTNVYELLLTLYPNTWQPFLFYFSPSGGCVVASHQGFTLHLSDDNNVEHLFTGL